jgi:adenylate kinase family enzyme
MKIKWPHTLSARALPNLQLASAHHYLIESLFGHLHPEHDMCIMSMERVIIIGSSGSGKSTLARQLGQKTGLPVIHLDLHYWYPGWVASPDEVWRKEVQELSQKPRWIMDGNYRETLDLRLAAADTVLFLDLPPLLCAWRAIYRRLQYRRRQRPDMAPGCQETLFGPDFPEFLLRIWDYPQRARPDVLKRLAELDGATQVFHFQSRSEIHRFIANPGQYAALLPRRSVKTGSQVSRA